MRNPGIIMFIFSLCLAAPAQADWNLTIEVDAFPTSTERGYDGIHEGTDDNGNQIFCSGAEQGGNVVVWSPSSAGNYRQDWGVSKTNEHVICGVDLDGDGYKDVVSAQQNGRLIRVFFGPYGAVSSVDLAYRPPGETVDQGWSQVQFATIDSYPAFVAGGRRLNGHQATWGWWQIDPGTAQWVYHPQGNIGDTMAMQVLDWDGDGDDDVYWTDGIGPNNTASLKGSYRALNDGTGGFSTTHLRQLGGTVRWGVAFDGDSDGDYDFVHGKKEGLIERCTNNGQDFFTCSTIPALADTENFHAPAICPDTTMDGPFIFTYALASDGNSGVVMAQYDTGTSSWIRTEISGPAGTGITRKFDNAICGFTTVQTTIRWVRTTEGGDSTASDDLGGVLYVEP